MTEQFDPKLVEQAARALPLHRMITAGGREELALAVLSAVADPLRAEGAACSCGGSGLYPNEVPGVGTEWVSCPDCNRAEIEAIAYQRGMVKGARQVRAAVEETVGSWGLYSTNGVGIPYIDGVNNTLAATREAVARIEKEQS